MSLFVDFAGMNTLVSSSFVTGSNTDNILSSGRNTSVASIAPADELVGINLHRNGPYGYSTWTQIRSSENPITRYQTKNSTMTFVTQPGPIRNILQDGELRVRDRYSALYNFTEPALAQKGYPLIWNVGRHFKTRGGDLDLFRYSVQSSFANEHIGFANREVDNLHGFDSDKERTAYRAFYEKYAEGGLNDTESELTYWEFLRYRETVYPHMKNQFQNENLERPNFESFYRHNRADRTKAFETSSFGFTPIDALNNPFYFSQSTWPLDVAEDFLTRGRSVHPLNDYNIQSNGGNKGEGVLMAFNSQAIPLMSAYSNLNSSNLNAVFNAASSIDKSVHPSPLYSRRVTLEATSSVSNPSGMEIYSTGTISLLEGGALWEAGSTRQIKDVNGNYISSPKKPFYDTYEGYIEEARRRYKNFSVVPEFRMSTQVEDYLTNGASIELDMFDVTGGANNAQNSSQSQFYQIYSNSDFMRQFELINEDHKEFANGKVLSLRCKAVKKFLPYEGFYPAQRTVDLAKRFYDSYKNNITLFNENGVQLPDFNFGRQMVMAPLFAPGILFNTIKSGVAVDYPIITGSLTVKKTSNQFTINKSFDYRVPFEAIIEPKGPLSSIPLTSNEPHPSGNLSASAVWDGNGDDLYSKMANNFFAAVPEFFLPNGNFTSIASKKQGDGFILEKDKVYGMRVFMAKSYNKPRFFVYHSGAVSLSYPPPQDIIRTGEDSFRENFTMYSRPSAFGPPTFGAAQFSGTPFTFDQDRLRYSATAPTEQRNSVLGFNFPFTPPYYHGEAWCDIWITGSGQALTIDQIQAQSTASFTRFDNSFYTSNGVSMTVSGYPGPQSYADSSPEPYDSVLDRNALQLSASVNIFGIGKLSERNTNQLIVDTSLDQDARWVIQTKFETPMLNFNHVSGSDFLTLPQYGSGSVPRGMWHQYGRIPEETEGISLGVKPINSNWQSKVLGRTTQMENLAEVLGFSGVSNKIGRLRSAKTIYEAVVAVPFIEEGFEKKFFRLNKEQVLSYKEGGTLRDSLTAGDPQNQIGRSVLNQLQKMEKYIFPPSFDFLNNSLDEVEPIAMYIFEFSHRLSQQDLADIWQNLPPDIGTTMEESEVAITHPLLKKELLGEGGRQSGNTLIDMPNKLKWMVFKVKQRAASNYFKKTVLRNPNVNADAESGNVTQDEFGNTSPIQYNWPYDFFSLVELVKLDAEVEFGNFSEEQIANYTDSIPPYEGSTADLEKIEYIVGGLDDDILKDTDGAEEYSEEEVGTTVQPSNDKEGIFDTPSNIPQEDKVIYVQLKGRFTVEASKSPLESVQILTARTTSELLALGVQALNISSTTEQSFLSWAQEWYNTDPSFQQKKAEFQAGVDSAAALNQQAAQNNFVARVKRYAGKKFFENWNNLNTDSSKNRAATKSITSTRMRFGSNNMWNRGVDQEAESLLSMLASESKQILNSIYRSQYE